MYNIYIYIYIYITHIHHHQVTFYILYRLPPIPPSLFLIKKTNWQHYIEELYFSRPYNMLIVVSSKVLRIFDQRLMLDTVKR